MIRLHLDDKQYEEYKHILNMLEELYTIWSANYPGVCPYNWVHPSNNITSSILSKREWGSRVRSGSTGFASFVIYLDGYTFSHRMFVRPEDNRSFVMDVRIESGDNLRELKKQIHNVYQLVRKDVWKSLIKDDLHINPLTRQRDSNKTAKKLIVSTPGFHLYSLYHYEGNIIIKANTLVPIVNHLVTNI